VRAAELRRVPADDPAALALLDRYLALLHERIGPEFDFASPTAAPSTASEFEPENGGCWLVAYAGEHAVACGGFRRLDERSCEVKRMYVASEARRQGLGRALLAELERIALEEGYSRVRLDTAPGLSESRALYGAAGYKPVPRYNDNQWAAHWFEKAL
jgi:GNAT superfamily N-acetyltransferase